jgi:hypothetical protein
LGTQLVGLLPLSDWAPAAESWLLFLPAACLLHFTRGLAVRDRAANSPGRLVVNDPEQLPQSVRFFVNLVAAAASLVLVAGLAVWQCDSMIRFAGFAALTLFCSAWKIPLPGLHGTVSLGFVPIIAAMAQLSLGETLLLSLGSALVQLFWRPKERPRPVQVVFSASAVLLSNAAAFVVCRNFGAFGLDQSLVTFFAAACLVQYLTNTFLVSRVLAWLHARPVVGLWREFYFWSMPYYLACAAAGALIASLAREVGWSLPFLVLPLMAMVTVSYRCHLRRAT